MNTLYIIFAAVMFGLLTYLIIALLKPEWFK